MSYYTAYNTIRDIGVEGYRAGGNGCFSANDNIIGIDVENKKATNPDGYFVTNVSFVREGTTNKVTYTPENEEESIPFPYNITEAGSYEFTYRTGEIDDKKQPITKTVKCTTTSATGDSKGIYLCSANGYTDTNHSSVLDVTLTLFKTCTL